MRLWWCVRDGGGVLLWCASDSSFVAESQSICVAVVCLKCGRGLFEL